MLKYYCKLNNQCHEKADVIITIKGWCGIKEHGNIKNLIMFI